MCLVLNVVMATCICPGHSPSHADDDAGGDVMLIRSIIEGDLDGCLGLGLGSWRSCRDHRGLSAHLSGSEKYSTLVSQV